MEPSSKTAGVVEHQDAGGCHDDQSEFQLGMIIKEIQMDDVIASKHLSTKYYQNPNIVLRKENEFGVLLFNPENADVKVLASLYKR